MSKKKIPTSIKINGVDLQVKDVPELLELIEAVRGEEKDKLYGEIAKLESKVTTLEDKSKLTEAEAIELKDLRKAIARKEVEIEAKEKELEEAKKAQKDTGKVTGDGKEGDKDSDKIMESLKAFLTEQIAGVTKTVGDLRTDVEKKIGEVAGNLTTKTVTDYRKAQLAKYDGVIIEDLVPENLSTEAEVNAAIEKALVRSQDLIYKEVDGKRMSLKEIAEAEKAKKEQEKDGGRTYTPPGTPPTPPGGGDGDAGGKVLLKDIGKMDSEAYAKHRATLLKEAKTAVYTGSTEE